MTQDDTTPQSSPEQRAEELRGLAGPVSGWDGRSERPGGATAVTGDASPDADGPVPVDEPDALTNPDLDDVRSDEQGDEDVPGSVEDPYELRSMPVEPNPTDDDPGSYLNT